MQRISAAVLLPLTLWFFASFATLLRADHASFVNWVGAPLNAVLATMFVIIMFYHAMRGLQTIAEDYLHDDRVRVPVLAALPVIHLFLAVASVLAIARAIP